MGGCRLLYYKPITIQYTIPAQYCGFQLPGTMDAPARLGGKEGELEDFKGTK